jgi:hypothetical protein
MKKLYKVQKIEFFDDKLYLKVNGREFSFSLAEISERLAGASTIERETYRLSPSNYGIHWPLIDEDLSIPGLLKKIHDTSTKTARL